MLGAAQTENKKTSPAARAFSHPGLVTGHIHGNLSFKKPKAGSILKAAECFYINDLFKKCTPLRVSLLEVISEKHILQNSSVPLSEIPGKNDHTERVNI